MQKPAVRSQSSGKCTKESRETGKDGEKPTIGVVAVSVGVDVLPIPAPPSLRGAESERQMDTALSKNIFDKAQEQHLQHPLVS